MLNKNNERELAYFARVTDIQPMNADRLEAVYINGWACVCSKGEFHAGDLGVFFEADSKLPETEPFTSIEFLKAKNYCIKPQKIRGVVSSGLFLPLSAFGWIVDDAGTIIVPPSEQFGKTMSFEESDFLTEYLGVSYNVSEDNQRKAPSVDKYKRMAQRHPEIFRHKWAQWLMRRMWGKRLMFFFFGKKRDKKNGWPGWVVKTDEERCQNMPWLFNGSDEEWIATEKIDGTSTTFTLRGNPKKATFYICSRNVVFDKPDKKCFYDTNVYTEMATKYNMEAIMRNALKVAQKADHDVDFLTIQAETFGAKVQRRDYGMTDRDMRVFNIIWGFKDGATKRLNPIEGQNQAEAWGLSYVPVVDEHFILPSSCEELLRMAGGKSVIDGEMREGLVFRSPDGKKSFKAVDNNFLLKYHN